MIPTKDPWIFIPNKNVLYPVYHSLHLITNHIWANPRYFDQYQWIPGTSRYLVILDNPHLRATHVFIPTHWKDLNVQPSCILRTEASWDPVPRSAEKSAAQHDAWRSWRGISFDNHVSIGDSLNDNIWDEMQSHQIIGDYVWDYSTKIMHEIMNDRGVGVPYGNNSGQDSDNA